MLGRINHWAEPRGKVNSFRGALEKKTMIVHRTSLVPYGHRLRYPGSARIKFRRSADQAESS